MNFRRIFLVKCLLLLFPSVKCSITNWIYMAENESAFLSTATAGGDLYEVTWLRDKSKLLQLKNQQVTYYVNKSQCRCKLFPNGTLQIERVVKEDSGNYSVTVYQQDGKFKAEQDTIFTVLEPVPQPILSAECMNKTVSVKCEVKQKTKNETFIIELTHGESKKIQKNGTSLELRLRYSGMFKCAVKNKVSEKTAEKLINCSGQLDFYLILSIAGGAVFFVIFMTLLTYCIRKKKTERLEAEDEEEMMQARQVHGEMVARELPQPPCYPTPKQLRVQQRPLPQPHVQQQAVPPRPRPRPQQRTPNQPRDRP